MGTKRHGTGDRRSRQRGAVLVEAAIAMPLLFLLIFGMIEFGWIFFQYQDIRQGAREGARIAAVADTATTNEIILLTCERLEETDNTTITFSITNDPGGNPTSTIGDRGTVVVTREIDTITGFFNGMFDPTHTSTVQFRVEESVLWSNGSGACP
jgi:Flp pilus assembly protein TadG